MRRLGWACSHLYKQKNVVSKGQLADLLCKLQGHNKLQEAFSLKCPTDQYQLDLDPAGGLCWSES